MGIGLLSFVILVAIVLHRKLCDATPVLTLTPETYKFKPEDNLVLSCSVNESVDLFSVSFYQNMIETIWINNSTSCSFFNLIPNDKRNYSIICDPSNTKFTMIKYGLNVSDDKAVWFCRMISKAGGSCPVANNPCTSGSSRLMLHDENTSGGPGTTTITSVDFITPSTIIPTDNIGNSSVLPTSVYVVASGTLTSTDNISFGNAVTSSSITLTVSNSASVTSMDVVTLGTMSPTYNTGYSNVSVTLISVGTPISAAPIYNTDTVSQSSDSTQWWCKCDWCIGLSVASGGLLVFSLVIGIIIFSKKRKEIENHMCWQRLTITIAVVVVIIIVVTGVFAGIVCRCWKEKK